MFFTSAPPYSTEPLLAYSSSYRISPTNLVSCVRLWNLVRAQVAELPLEFLCTGLAFSPDGRLLITSTPSETKVWDVHSGKARAVCPGGSHQGIGTPFSITPDFHLLAQAGDERATAGVRTFTRTGTVERNDPRRHRRGRGAKRRRQNAGDERRRRGRALDLVERGDGRSHRALDRVSQRGNGAVVLVGGENLGVRQCGSDNRGMERLQPVEVPAPRLLFGHELEVWRVACLPDGKTLISGGKDGAVKFWDLQASLRHRNPIQLAASLAWAAAKALTKVRCRSIAPSPLAGVSRMSGTAS